MRPKGLRRLQTRYPGMRINGVVNLDTKNFAAACATTTFGADLRRMTLVLSTHQTIAQLISPFSSRISIDGPWLLPPSSRRTLRIRAR